MTIDFFPEIEISALQAEAIARGLYGIAVVDGVHERELALISDFYHDAVSGEASNAMASIERAGLLELKELVEQVEPAPLRELFVKAGFLLGERGPEWLESRGVPGRFVSPTGEVLENACWSRATTELALCT